MSTSARMAIDAMCAYTRDRGFDLRSPDQKLTYGNALIHRSRNLALACTRPDADVLFVDDDMLPPKEALVQLLSHRVPVASALCTSRMPPINLAVKLYDDASHQFIPVERMRPDKLVTDKFGVGAAFLLLSRDTIERLKEYYVSSRDWLEANRRCHDRMHVRAEFREKERARKEEIRRANWDREKYLLVFDYPVGENELQFGEDIGLCWHLAQLGIPVSIDTGVIVGHLGEHPYGPWDIPDQEEEAVA